MFSKRIKKFINLILSISIFYSQLAAESSYKLFPNYQGVISSAQLTKYTFDTTEKKFIPIETMDMFSSTVLSKTTFIENIKNQFRNFVTSNEEKISIEMEIFYDTNESLNYIETNFRGNRFGENRKSSLVKKTFVNTASNVKVFNSKFEESKSVLYSYGSTNGQRGQSFLVTNQYLNNGKNLRLNIEKVNLLNFYTNVLNDYCSQSNISRTEPFLLTTPGNILMIADKISDGILEPTGEDVNLTKMSGIIKLGDSNICDNYSQETRGNIYDALLNTNLFNEDDGSLRMNSKDYTSNTSLLASVTSDLMFHNNVFEGYLSSDYKSDLKNKSNCCKRCLKACCKDRYWQEYYVWNRMYKMFPITVVSSNQSLDFGSFSFENYNKNGYKVSGLAPTPSASGIILTPSGHTINHLLIGTTTDSTSETFDSGPTLSITPKVTYISNKICKWAAWVLIVVAIIVLVVTWWCGGGALVANFMAGFDAGGVALGFTAVGGALAASVGGFIGVTLAFSNATFMMIGMLYTAYTVYSVVSTIMTLLELGEKPNMSMGNVNGIGFEVPRAPLIPKPIMIQILSGDIFDIPRQLDDFTGNEKFYFPTALDSTSAYTISDGSMVIGDDTKTIAALYMKDNDDFWNSEHWITVTTEFNTGNFDSSRGVGFNANTNLNSLTEVMLDFMEDYGVITDRTSYNGNIQRLDESSNHIDFSTGY